METNEKLPLLVITGATASGKTALAVRLADIFPIEVVNADSRAFYRGMDIGTAKPTVEDRARASHHLVDILDPDDPMSLSVFQRLAVAAIDDIHGRGALPVLVGGTPQYINAVVEGWNIPQAPPNVELRMRLERQAEQEGVASLLAWLKSVDPVAAEKTGPNLRRIVRALEVYLVTGTPISKLQTRGEAPYAAVEFELWWPRDVLYSRIDERVDRQIAEGLVDEVRALLAAGYDPRLPSFSSIGYRQLAPTIVDDLPLSEAVARIKLDTHRLVRHQQTWARKNTRLARIDMTEPDAEATIIDAIRVHVSGFLASR